jgi:dTDP-4-dehydrorhamnose reductase
VNVTVTGAGGLLAPFLVDALTRLGPVDAIGRRDCELRDLPAVRARFAVDPPDVIVHSAAYTDVDGCERDPDRAHLDNVVATQNVVTAAPAPAHIVFLSSDQVYPDTPGPHDEPDTDPVNVYGTTKLEAEAAVGSHRSGLVLRCNFFAVSRTPGRTSLADVVIAAVASGRTFTGFEDLLFSPLHATTLASLVTGAVESRIIGTFNVGSSDGCTKAEFARLVARHTGHDDSLVTSAVSAGVANRAPRAHDLRMDVESFAGTAGLPLPTVRDEIDRL